MQIEKDKLRVFGRRVLVENEKIDLGGLKGTPALEQDGKKNTGKIVVVGQATLRDRFAGIKAGATIHFRKYFRANDGTEDALVFVDIENITGINK